MKLVRQEWRNKAFLYTRSVLSEPLVINPGRVQNMFVITSKKRSLQAYHV